MSLWLKLSPLAGIRISTSVLVTSKTIDATLQGPSTCLIIYITALNK